VIRERPSLGFANRNDGNTAPAGGAEAFVHRIDPWANPFGSRALRVAFAVGVHEQNMKRTLESLRPAGNPVCSRLLAVGHTQSLDRAEIHRVAAVEQQMLDGPSQKLVQKAMIGETLSVESQSQPTLRHSEPTVAR
jgi:hypothetical protein